MVAGRAPGRARGVDEVAGAQEPAGAEAQGPGGALVLGRGGTRLGRRALGQGVELGRRRLADDEDRRLRGVATHLADGLHPGAAVVGTDEHDVGPVTVDEVAEADDEVGDVVDAREVVEHRGEMADQAFPRGRRSGEDQARSHFTLSSPR